MIIIIGAKGVKLSLLIAYLVRVWVKKKKNSRKTFVTNPENFPSRTLKKIDVPNKKSFLSKIYRREDTLCAWNSVISPYSRLTRTINRIMLRLQIKGVQDDVMYLLYLPHD